MKPRQKRALRQWLAAERRGADREAERALEGLWRTLGRPAPSPGFARRTLERAVRRPLRRRGWARRLAPSPPGWVSRGVLAAALTLVAVSMTLAPLSLVKLASAGPRLLSGAVGLVPDLSARLAHGLTAWSVAGRISDSLIAGLIDPPAAAALGAALLMSLVAFGWLTRLLTWERSPEHA